MPKKFSEQAVAVATGSPQDESVRCADLWPVEWKRRIAFPMTGRATGEWLHLSDDRAVK